MRALFFGALVLSLSFSSSGWGAEDCASQLKKRSPWKRAATLGAILAAATVAGPAFVSDPEPLPVVREDYYPEPDILLTDILEKANSQTRAGYRSLSEAQGISVDYLYQEQAVVRQPKPRGPWERVLRQPPREIPRKVRSGHQWRFLVFQLQTDETTSAETIWWRIAHTDLRSEVSFRTAHLEDRGEFARVTGRPLTQEDLDVSADSLSLSHTVPHTLDDPTLPPAAVFVRKKMGNVLDRLISSGQEIQARVPEISSDPESRYFLYAFFLPEQERPRVVLLIHVLGEKAQAFELID